MNSYVEALNLKLKMNSLMKPLNFRYAILPQGSDYIWESDAQFFENETDSYDEAIQWSVELNGQLINLCHRDSNGNWNVISQVYA